MRKTMTVAVFALALVSFLGAVSFAAATPEDAKAWVKKAVEYYKANGKEQALAAFDNSKGEFVKDDLYIYVLSLDGEMLAHPNKSLVGKDFMKVKDADGKLFAMDIVGEAKAKGNGWVEYKWGNPTTQKVEPKTVYFEKIDDVIIAAGAYKK